MANKTKAFEDFQTGEFISFNKSFSKREFNAFSEMSGDKNPLHHDDEYGKASEFGETIVPVHMTSAPLSAIAGMYLPGVPSLYLRHDINALKPVYYGEPLVYSAKITGISRASRLLELSVIVFNSETLEVKLSANMNVQAREESWGCIYEENLQARKPAKKVLITGASGEIASAIAMHYARNGWGVILNYRSENDRIKRIKEYCTEKNLYFDTVDGDLADNKTYTAIAKKVAQGEGVYRIIHSASPAIHAEASQHFELNFTALKHLSNLMMPQLLEQQAGGVVLIGSTATDSCPIGWEAYAAGKSAGMNLLKQYRQRFGTFGLEFSTFSPGMVKTAFSSDYHDANINAALPEEVAEKLFATVEASHAGHAPAQIIYDNGEVYTSAPKSGAYGNVLAGGANADNENQSQIDTTTRGDTNPSDMSQKLANVMGSFLNLSSADDIESSRLGSTPGWDSLRHIELILNIERAFDVRFTSAEMSGTHSFKGLAAKVSEKCLNA